MALMNMSHRTHTSLKNLNNQRQFPDEHEHFKGPALKKLVSGIPWWSSGWGSVLSLLRARV